VLKRASLLRYCVRKIREPDRSGWIRWVVGSGQAEVSRRRKDKALLRRAELRTLETETSSQDMVSESVHPYRETNGHWEEVRRWKGWDEWEEGLRAVDPSEEE
jgi:hypothetical protein